MNKESHSRELEDSVLEHLGLLYSVALKLTKNKEKAQFVVQHAIARVLNSSHIPAQDTGRKGWLLTVLRNTFIDDFGRDGGQFSFLSLMDRAHKCEWEWSSPENFEQGRRCAAVAEAHGHDIVKLAESYN